MATLAVGRGGQAPGFLVHRGHKARLCLAQAHGVPLNFQRIQLPILTSPDLSTSGFWLKWSLISAAPSEVYLPDMAAEGEDGLPSLGLIMLQRAEHRLASEGPAQHIFDVGSALPRGAQTAAESGKNFPVGRGERSQMQVT